MPDPSSSNRPVSSGRSHRSVSFALVALIAATLSACNPPPKTERARATRASSTQAIPTASPAAPPGSRRIPTIPYASTRLAPGTLDPHFGVRGVVTHHNAGGGGGNENGEAVAVDAQGRIVVAGYSTNANGALVMTVWRFMPSGALDPSFNGTGFATHNGGGGANASDQAVASSIVIDSNGRILVAGYSIAANIWGMAMWRLTDSGSFDTSFGLAADKGMVRFPAPQSGGTSVALNPNGHIRTVGFTWNGFNWDTALWRYGPNGAFDAGLGYIYDNRSAGSSSDAVSEDIAVDVAFDPSNRIVLTGYRTNADGNQDMSVLRFDDDGVPDSAFGTNGMITHGNAAGGNGNDVGRAIAFANGGKIVIAGWSPRGSVDTNADMAIWRFNSDGTLDTSFNGSGFVTHHGAAGGNATDWGRAVAIDNGGRTVVAGQSANAAGNADLAVWRYKNDGTLDTLFGGRGWIVHAGAAGGSNANDAGRGLAIDASQRLVVVGRSTNASGNLDLAVWRIIP